MLPFKDQKSANSVRRQLGDLSRKINVDISPVYTSRKIKDEIKVRENKPPLVNQQCVVYNFQCTLCDAGYVGYTCRHLHQHKGSAIGSHLKEQHDIAPDDIAQFFKILKKCQSTFNCLIFEMFFYQRTETISKQTVLIILIVFNCFRSIFSLFKLLTSLIFCHLFLHIYIFYHISAFAKFLPDFTISIYLC